MDQIGVVGCEALQPTGEFIEVRIPVVVDCWHVAKATTGTAAHACLDAQPGRAARAGRFLLAADLVHIFDRDGRGVAGQLLDVSTLYTQDLSTYTSDMPGPTVEVISESEDGGPAITTVLRGDDAAAFVERVQSAANSFAGLSNNAKLSALRFASDDAARGSLVEAIASVPLPMPSTESAVTNAIRVREFRQSLVDRGAFTVDDLSAGVGMKRGTAQKWLERHVKAGRLFTVKVDGRVMVPASLLDSAFDPIEAWAPVLAELAEVESSGWGMWAWIDGPSALLSGEVPSDVIDLDPGRVLLAAKRRVAQAQP